MKKDDVLKLKPQYLRSFFLKTFLIAFNFLIYFSFAFILGCDSNPVDGRTDINPNIVKLNIPSTNNFVAVLHQNDIYSVTPPYHFKITNNYEVIEINELQVPWGNWTYIEINESGTKLLLVKSLYNDASGGSLYEFNIRSEKLTLLKDSSHNVSSAVYFHENDDKIIYYKYGDPVGAEPGYYLYDKFLDQDRLLFSYISLGGPTELVNGFDLHPNNDRILIPICRSTLLDARTPMLGEFSFGSNRIDTLSIEFDLSFVRIGIWGRYNQDGTQILYCVYPKGAYTETTNDNSEVGIIDYFSLEKKILDVNTNPNGKSVQLAPNWSNDFQSIIYGSGRLTIEGAAGRRGLYILKQLN